jgi:phosphoribosylformimino-5-aminoimidazole carboxamide ribotide isomerase
MLLMPAVDLRAGRCVRLRRGDFAAETRYPVDPQVLLRRYQELGATWVHVVDLDGAKEGVPSNLALIARLARTSPLYLQVGGGVRSAHVIEALLNAGAARVVVGSAAVHQPQEVARWLKRFGPERLSLAFDVRVDVAEEAFVYTHGWACKSDLTLESALEPFSERLLRHVLCTDIDRDGVGLGPNLALYRRVVAHFPQFAWQASGGLRDATDLAALASLNVASAVSGRALLEDSIPQEELRPFLPDASFPASTSATVKS